MAQEELDPLALGGSTSVGPTAPINNSQMHKVTKLVTVNSCKQVQYQINKLFAGLKSQQTNGRKRL